jgi:4-azaleucine resistance transporter AzlC
VGLPRHLDSQVQTRQQAYRQGAKDAFPSVIGLIPFGLIVGTASTAAGMDPWLALAMSIIVYAGASQLAAIALMVQSAPMAIVLATVLVVNLRFVMYSASLAPFFRELSTGRKWLLSYGLTDHLFALVNARFTPDGSHKHVDAYYIGGAVPTWLTWNTMVAIGIFAGTLVPKQWSLDFAIPLVFLALVFPALTSRTHWITAGVALVAAVFTAGLPMKLGLITAAFVAVAIGTWLDYRQDLEERIAE